MLFTTPTQYLALAVALIAGWLFGPDADFFRVIR